MLKQRFVVSGMLLLLIASTAMADTYYSVASGDYNANTTWNDGVPPPASSNPGHPQMAADIARVDDGNTISISSAAVSGDLQISYDTTTCAVDIGSGGALTLTSGDYLSVGQDASSTGFFMQSGGSMNLTGAKIIVGNSSSSSPGTGPGTQGEYDFSGGSLVQSTSTSSNYDTLVGYQGGSYAASTGTFSVIGNASGSSIALSYLYVGDEALTTAGTANGTLKFTLGSSGVTPIGANRLYVAQGGATANLDIALSSAPTPSELGSTGTITLVSVSSTVDTGVFSNLGTGNTVSATYGNNTYTWTVTQTGGTGHDLDLINGYISSTPEPVATTLIGFAGLAIAHRPNRRRRVRMSCVQP